ncbi:MAG: methyltransferase domain-containing protein [Clostridiales bacterium]
MRKDFKNLREEEENITKAYNFSSNKYADYFKDELDEKTLDKELLNRFSKDINYGKVLDIGCGPGHISNYLFKIGCNVQGVDISKGMINVANKLFKGIKFNIGDMFAIDERDNYFDGVCSFYSIVNFSYENLDKVIKEYKRILKNNGLLFIAFHVGNEKLTADNFLDSNISLDFYMHDLDKIVDLLKNNNFEISEAIIRYPYKSEHGTRRAYIIAKIE